MVTPLIEGRVACDPQRIVPVAILKSPNLDQASAPKEALIPATADTVILGTIPRIPHQ
jgi:hypothetical protein